MQKKLNTRPLPHHMAYQLTQDIARYETLGDFSIKLQPMSATKSETSAYACVFDLVNVRLGDRQYGKEVSVKTIDDKQVLEVKSNRTAYRYPIDYLDDYGLAVFQLFKPKVIDLGKNKRVDIQLDSSKPILRDVNKILNLSPEVLKHYSTSADGGQLTTIIEPVDDKLLLSIYKFNPDKSVYTHHVGHINLNSEYTPILVNKLNAARVFVSQPSSDLNISVYDIYTSSTSEVILTQSLPGELFGLDIATDASGNILLYTVINDDKVEIRVHERVQERANSNNMIWQSNRSYGNSLLKAIESLGVSGDEYLDSKLNLHVTIEGTVICSSSCYSKDVIIITKGTGNNIQCLSHAVISALKDNESIISTSNPVASKFRQFFGDVLWVSPTGSHIATLFTTMVDEVLSYRLGITTMSRHGGYRLVKMFDVSDMVDELSNPYFLLDGATTASKLVFGVYTLETLELRYFDTVNLTVIGDDHLPHSNPVSYVPSIHMHSKGRFLDLGYTSE